MRDESSFKAVRCSHGGMGFKCPCCNRFGMSTRRRHEVKRADSRFVRRKLKMRLRLTREED
jgi:hypothetical protein